MTERQDWTKTPRQRAAAWYAKPLEATDRAFATDLLVCMDGEVWEGSWPDLLALFLRNSGADSRNRKRIHLAFDRMREAGLLLEHEGRVLLLFAEPTLRKYRSVRDRALAERWPDSQANPTPCNRSSNLPKKGAAKGRKAPAGDAEVPPTAPQDDAGMTVAERWRSNQATASVENLSTPTSQRERSERENYLHSLDQADQVDRARPSADRSGEWPTNVTVEPPLPPSTPLEAFDAGPTLSETLRRRFVAAWEERHAGPPWWSGQHWAELVTLVERTAQIRRRDPVELFVETLQTYLHGGQTKFEQNNPVCGFLRSWTSLTTTQKPLADADRRPLSRAEEAEARRKQLEHEAWKRNLDRKFV